MGKLLDAWEKKNIFRENCEMKKILHLLRRSQFTEGYINFINNNCIDQEHFFLVYGSKFYESEETYLLNKNIRSIYIIAQELRKPCIDEFFGQYDSIIYHGLFDFCILEFFYEHEELLSKLILYFWGGDIPLLQEGKNAEVKKKVIANAKCIVTIIVSDQQKIEDLYHPQGDRLCAQYYDDKQVQMMKKYFTDFSNDHDTTINIQIGNSATETNEHKTILDMLKKYKDENIRIYLPMSYGDMEYAETIEKYAKDIFSEKLVVLKTKMELEDYIKYLSKIDVAVFGVKRQQALGNIFMLLANGCKVFVWKDGPLKGYLNTENEITVYDIENLITMNFSDFIDMPLEEHKNNVEKIYKNIFSKENAIMKWNRVFDV